MRFFFEYECLEKNHMFEKKSHVDMELFMFNMTDLHMHVDICNMHVTDVNCAC